MEQTETGRLDSDRGRGRLYRLVPARFEYKGEHEGIYYEHQKRVEEGPGKPHDGAAIAG